MISRRTFISGSLGVIGATSTVGVSSLLAGCSGDSTPANSIGALGDIQIVQRFPQVLVPGNVRLPISLANQAGLLTTESGVDLPATLTA